MFLVRVYFNKKYMALIKIRGDLVDIMADIAPDVYAKFVMLNKKGGKQLLVQWQNAIYGTMVASLLFYRKFRKKKAELKDLYQFDQESRTTSTNPEDILELENFRSNLKKTVRRLPKRQKMVFELRHYSGLKHHEISGMLGVSLGTVKSLYHRAVQTIKKKLGGVESFLHQEDVGWHYGKYEVK